VPGYEQVGIVEWVGCNAKPTFDGRVLEVGQRVMANEIRTYPSPLCASWGGQVAWSVKNPTVSGGPFDWPSIIPDNITDQQAVVAYLAAVAHKGIEKVGINKGESVLVIGAGAVGVSAAQLARIYGCGRLLLMDKSQWRLDRVKHLVDETICVDGGAPFAHELVIEANGGKGVDVLIEASGDSNVINWTRKMVREGGWDLDDDGARIHFQGDYPDPISLTPYQEWFNRNLRISMSCAILPGGKEKILELISNGQFDADVLWDKEIALESAPSEYEELDLNRLIRMKTLIDWRDQTSSLCDAEDGV
jgi:threonine dehydrogenase-like Zn-dependent dehydrogenase